VRGEFFINTDNQSKTIYGTSIEKESAQQNWYLLVNVNLVLVNQVGVVLLRPFSFSPVRFISA
jgi:hypothetical protein